MTGLVTSMNRRPAASGPSSNNNLALLVPQGGLPEVPVLAMARIWDSYTAWSMFQTGRVQGFAVRLAISGPGRRA